MQRNAGRSIVSWLEIAALALATGGCSRIEPLEWSLATTTPTMPTPTPSQTPSLTPPLRPTATVTSTPSITPTASISPVRTAPAAALIEGLPDGSLRLTDPAYGYRLILSAGWVRAQPGPANAADPSLRLIVDQEALQVRLFVVVIPRAEIPGQTLETFAEALMEEFNQRERTHANEVIYLTNPNGIPLSWMDYGDMANGIFGWVCNALLEQGIVQMHFITPSAVRVEALPAVEAVVQSLELLEPGP